MLTGFSFCFFCLLTKSFSKSYDIGNHFLIFLKTKDATNPPTINPSTAPKDIATTPATTQPSPPDRSILFQKFMPYLKDISLIYSCARENIKKYPNKFYNSCAKYS